ncbi:MAG TPA: SinR family protein [bacterium]|nr:SinR family protein [bacterium]
MNMAYIISYDLKDPGKNYEKLLHIIKGYENWARLGGSAYIIITTKTPVEVRDSLNKALDNNDKLYVGLVKAPAAWQGMPDEVSTWLRNNLH